MYNKVLGAVAILAAGWLVLLWWALVYGAVVPDSKQPNLKPQAFPFRTVVDSLEGWTAEVRNMGDCDTTKFTLITIYRPDGSEGWYLYYSDNDRIVGVRYPSVIQRSPADLVVYAVVERQMIRVIREEPFAAAIHEGPCQWLDTKEA